MVKACSATLDLMKPFYESPVSALIWVAFRTKVFPYMIRTLLKSTSHYPFQVMAKQS